METETQMPVERKSQDHTTHPSFHSKATEPPTDDPLRIVPQAQLELNCATSRHALPWQHLGPELAPQK